MMSLEHIIASFFPAFLFPNACPCIMIRACLYFIQKNFICKTWGNQGFKKRSDGLF